MDESDFEERGTWGAYLVQFYLLLLTEVTVTVLEVFQDHFLPRSIEKRGLAVAWTNRVQQPAGSRTVGHCDNQQGPGQWGTMIQRQGPGQRGQCCTNLLVVFALSHSLDCVPSPVIVNLLEKRTIVSERHIHPFHCQRGKALLWGVPVSIQHCAGQAP